MKNNSYEIYIDSQLITLCNNSEVMYGNNEVIINKEDNLIEDLHWNNNGYCIESFIDILSMNKLKSLLENLIEKILIESSVTVNDKFCLEYYHDYVKSDLQHDLIIKEISPYLPIKYLGDFAAVIKKKIEEICNCELNYMSDNQNELFNIRIARPNRIEDSNPPHKDIYIDRLKNKINIYLPICGSNKYSSLALIPNSHFYNEKDILRTIDGSIINNKKYYVSAITAYRNNSLQLVRPDPKFNEVMVFSPYMIHGAGYNFNFDVTRVSLEIRFEKVKKDEKQ